MIGIVGLGKMGRAIAERLTGEGESLVVWNRTPGKADGLEQVTEVSSPAEVVAASPVTLSVLANDTAIDAVYRGPNGLLSAPLEGQVIVEMCTTSPDRAASLEADVKAVGGLFLECPVGGTIGPARNGKLLGLAGGSDAAFAAARPTLEQITRRLEHLGPAGSGAAMKLAINLPLMVYWGALGEALGLALDRGIDINQAADILIDSSGAIGAAKGRVPPIRDLIATGEAGGVAFSLSNALKDMGLMEELAAGGGRSHDVISAVRARAESAAAAGYADLDASMLAAFGHRDLSSD